MTRYVTLYLYKPKGFFEKVMSLVSKQEYLFTAIHVKCGFMDHVYYYDKDGIRVANPRAFKKVAGMSGPIGQALSRSFVIVPGNSGCDLRLCRAAQRVAEEIRLTRQLVHTTGTASDAAMVGDPAFSTDLLLLGTAASNACIRRIEHDAGRIAIR